MKEQVFRIDSNTSVNIKFVGTSVDVLNKEEVNNFFSSLRIK